MRVRTSRRRRSRASRTPALRALELLNRTRLERFRALLAPRAREALELLPLLLHLPETDLAGVGPLPGAGGVHGLRPGLGQLLRLTGDRGTALALRGRQRPPQVLALYLMGSPGSVSYNARSDWDLWLCHPSSLDGGERRALRRRLATLARWARGHGVTLHGFLVDPERLRAGEVEALSEESSGSAQHYLLLDEFYRSAIRLAGQWPLWWLVPPEREHDYANACAELVARSPNLADECLDLGGLGTSPAAEFLGAGVWQLAKSVGAPEKSLLKLMLIESYVAAWPRLQPLALATKAAVHGGDIDADVLDPYLQLYAHLERHLADDPERLTLVRRALYRKIGLPLSDPEARRGWRYPLVAALVRRWGWDADTIAELDSGGALPIERLRREQQQLMRALTASYQRLSRFAREQAVASRISASDLHVLGRRLYAAFERRPGKVERLGGVLGQRPAREPALVLRVTAASDGSTDWALGRDRGDGTVLLKTARHCAELLAWCTVNGIADPTATLQVEVAAGVTAPRAGALRRALAALGRHLPAPQPERAPLYRYAEPARARSAVLLVNLERQATADPALARRLAGGADPLNYGSARESLAVTMDLVTTTTWEECLCRHADDEPGPLLAELVRQTAHRETPAPRVVAWGDGYAGALTRRLCQLTDEARAFLGDASDPIGRRFIVEIGGCYGTIERDGGTVSYRQAGDRRGLWRLLSRPLASPWTTGVDSHILRDSPLPAMLAAADNGRLDVFVIDAGERLSVVVIDEFGALGPQHYRHQPASHVLQHLERFLTASAGVRARLGLQPLGPTRHHTVRRTGADAFEVVARHPTPAPLGPYLSVHVVGDLDERGNPHYTVYCDDVEFSPQVHGNAVLSAAARHIRERRRGGDDYPVYVTAVDLSDTLLASRHPQGLGTGHLLHYKRVIEERLNADPAA